MDKDDYTPPSEPVEPAPILMPVKPFTAYYDNNDEVDIIGVTYDREDECLKFVGIACVEGEIWPTVISSSVYRAATE